MNVSDWFADLISSTREKLDDMPVGTCLEIINQLKDCPEANDFFSIASLAFNEIDAPSDGSQSGSGGSDSETD